VRTAPGHRPVDEQHASVDEHRVERPVGERALRRRTVGDGHDIEHDVEGALPRDRRRRDRGRLVADDAQAVLRRPHRRAAPARRPRRGSRRG
jgi:hypothetical protein